MVAVVSGKGGTSSRLCSAPNFSTSENLGRERESSEIGFGDEKGKVLKLDPVGSTVRYEMMKLCTGSV